MKHLLIGVIYFFLAFQTFAQSFINNELKSIIYSQMYDATERVMPVFMAMPGWYFYGTYTYSDQETYFREKPVKDLNQLTFREIVSLEVQNNIPLVYSQTLYPARLQVNSFYNDHLSVNIQITNADSLSIIDISNVDGSFRREARYSHEKLNYLVFTNSRGNFITQYNYSDTLIRKTTFNTANRKYRVTDECYNNNVIQKRTVYKSSRSRDKLHVNYSELFSYDAAQRLVSLRKYNSRDVAMDSTVYIYGDNFALENIFRQGARKTNKYVYNARHVIMEKSIETPDNMVTVTYQYDHASRLSRLELRNRNTNESARFTLIYDTESRLSEVSRYDYSGSADQWTMSEKFMLKYNDRNLLETISRIENNGLVSRMLRYD
jgi:hypothetical protein